MYRVYKKMTSKYSWNIGEKVPGTKDDGLDVVYFEREEDAMRFIIDSLNETYEVEVDYFEKQLLTVQEIIEKWQNKRRNLINERNY